MLDLIARALEPRLAERDFSFVRIDGTCSLQQCRDALDRFNSERACVIMLATIGTAGEGFVFLLLSMFTYFDVSWFQRR
jgi:SNF2 family DNA or RNA helicase